MFIVVMGLIICIIVGYVVFSVIKHYKNNKTNSTEVHINVKPDNSKRKPVKKALLVGINKYRPDLGADLQGCVNDVENMRNMLVNIFKFPVDNVRVIINDRATRQGILDRLKWLLDGSKAGDELVFHYSGHGSQVRDRNGDELDDQLDEILCPYDLDWNNPLTDDILADLFKQIPVGVYLTMLSDSCHSGTITRGLDNPGNPGAIILKPRYIAPPFDIKSRSLGKILPKNRMGKKSGGAQRHVLVSGCRDNQTSADAHIDGKPQGAFTWAISTAIKEDPNRTWSDAHKKAVELLARYSQVPQLSGSADLIFRPVFGNK